MNGGLFKTLSKTNTQTPSLVFIIILWASPRLSFSLDQNNHPSIGGYKQVTMFDVTEPTNCEAFLK